MVACKPRRQGRGSTALLAQGSYHPRASSSEARGRTAPSQRGNTKHLDCKRAVAGGTGGAESGTKGAPTVRGPAERHFQEATRRGLRTGGKRAGSSHKKKVGS